MSDQFGCDDVLERARAARPSGGHDRIATEEMQHEDHFTQIHTRHRGAPALVAKVLILSNYFRVIDGKIVGLTLNFNQPLAY